MALSRLISFYSKKYGTPLFPPHLTLQGGLKDYTLDEVTEKTKGVLQQWQGKAFSLYFSGNAIVSDEYFRSLVLEVVKHDDLMRLNTELRDAFPLSSDNQRDYFPHVSIIYSDESQLSRSTKENDIKPIIEQGGWTKLPEFLGVADPEVVGASNEVSEMASYLKSKQNPNWPSKFSFTACSVLVIDIASDEVDDWKIVKEIPFDSTT